MITIMIAFGAISVGVLAWGIVEIINSIINKEDLILGGFLFILGSIGLFLSNTLISFLI